MTYRKNAGFDASKETTAGLVYRLAINAARVELYAHQIAPKPTEADQECAQQCWHELNRRFPTEAP